ncbi:MAG: hypothetical protein Q8M29_19845 [Bacteroidota bacterium]|nr:hypothetical protein [Bacteroidota bacterium]
MEVLQSASVPKKIIYILILCCITFTQIYGKFGYRSKTIGIIGGANYYLTSPLYNTGVYFDRFYKNCLSNRTYESIALEYSFKRKEYNFNTVSLKLSKGILKPFLLGRILCLHSVASLNSSYIINSNQNNLTLRPELGFVLTGSIVKPIATRLALSYGYNFALKEQQKNTLSGHYAGIKLFVGLDLSKLKKQKTPEPSEEDQM